MRIAIEIDDDVLEAAKTLARQTQRTAGAVISDLARRALTMASPTLVRSKKAARGVGAFVPFASRGGIVTNEQIDRLRDHDVY